MYVFMNDENGASGKNFPLIIYIHTSNCKISIYSEIGNSEDDWVDAKIINFQIL